MEWEPKKTEHTAIGLNAITSTTTSLTPPEPQLPSIGDTMKIVVYPWGHMNVYNSSMEVPTDARIIEVEVKGIKNVRIVFE